jgi:hypothetical protein
LHISDSSVTHPLPLPGGETFFAGRHSPPGRGKRWVKKPYKIRLFEIIFQIILSQKKEGQILSVLLSEKVPMCYSTALILA